MKTHTNVDVSELDKFSKLASLWWDEHGSMGMLHKINPIRFKFIADQVDVANKQVLDVGCGGGILTESLARAGANAMGIDLSSRPLEIAKLHAKEVGIKIDYRLKNCEEMADTHAKKFDVVCCLEMLEHVPDPASTVKACAKLLKPGGYAFFSTINRSLKAFLFAIIGGEYVLRLLPRGTHSYKSLIKPSELHKWSQQNGLTLLDTSSFIYNPLTKNFRLRTGADVNYISCYQKNL
ncbi:MAG: bifunctional 2-polyprenyl-6-hydroxyphenol methylase/3-demethylubiquinol 3-O-methyltransferase UbiG [Alphaproteobacteria bacterium]|nr:bifunctional 2-polyprenyl-6-hydroxyphenol methylase/3-demethylubiquinol 3-O-methyltransferase UbiG [Alphaproteobacteria bacterium]OJV45561.1 MAG: bifunctional 3-demethylubiquinol 3-O-methyltransferase/2-polyprenyl-6-hydroxyphenol methylase [Alphaproteobacteria bacterium 43-37]